MNDERTKPCISPQDVLLFTLGYSRKNPNREVEDMEFPGVSKK